VPSAWVVDASHVKPVVSAPRLLGDEVQRKRMGEARRGLGQSCWRSWSTDSREPG